MLLSFISGANWLGRLHVRPHLSTLAGDNLINRLLTALRGLQTRTSSHGSRTSSHGGSTTLEPAQVFIVQARAAASSGSVS